MGISTGVFLRAIIIRYLR